MAETDDIFIERVDSNGEIVRLRLVDYGGVGPAALLLHGLAGAAHEWRDTSAWLCETHHVFAFDQRGHGGSAKRLISFSREEFVADAVDIIEAITSDPVLLVGQSHGGVTALLVAARYPDLVSRLVVIEAGILCNPNASSSIARWLDSWPVPFADRMSARVFFGGDTNAARVWAEMLVETSDGFRPVFHRDDMIASVREGEAIRDYADDWRRIICPIHIVAGKAGWIGCELERMIALNARASIDVILGAGHDVHLDAPELWKSSAERFLCGAEQSE